MKRYGMKHRMIHYLQTGARQHVCYNGDPGVFQRQLQYHLRKTEPASSSRDIGYAVIKAAAVCHTAVIRYTITRG